MELFLCPADIVRRALCFRVVLRSSVHHAVVSDRSLCQFYRYLIETVKFAYVLSMFVFRQLLIFRSPGQRSVTFFVKTIPSHYLCQFYRYLLDALHTHYLCCSPDTYRFWGHQVKGQSDSDRFCENHFRPSLTHTVVSDLYLCQFYRYLTETLHTHYLCLSSDTYRFSGHQVKATVTVFVKTISGHYLCQFYRYLPELLHTLYLCWSSDTYWFWGHQVSYI